MILHKFDIPETTGFIGCGDRSTLAVLVITLLAMQSYYGLQTYNFNKLNICLGSILVYGNRTLNSDIILGNTTGHEAPVFAYIK